VQHVKDLTGVIRVGRGARGNHAQVVSARYGMGVRSADAPGSLCRNTAGPHGAVLAANPILAEFAVGGLVLYPILPSLGMNKGRHFFQLGGYSFHFFNGRKMFQGSQNNSPP
jgi:hypothetical protein